MLEQIDLSVFFESLFDAFWSFRWFWSLVFIVFVSYEFLIPYINKKRKERVKGLVHRSTPAKKE